MRVPANRVLNGSFPTKDQLPLRDFLVVDGLAKEFLQLSRQSLLADVANWIETEPDPTEFFDFERSYYTRPPIPFQPFAQKLVVDPASVLIFHGDFHGDIRSFISTLDWLNQNGHLDGFRVKNPKTYLIFLGDYTDRGAYGVEVIYTLLRLKLENPDHVFMARGNHEDFQMTAAYGFLREGQTKYGKAFSPVSIWRMFDFLPVVIYVGTGTDFIQCNHGGMEPGYDPKPLLNSKGKMRFQMLEELKQKTFVRQHPNWVDMVDKTTRQLVERRLFDFSPRSPTQPATIGFMWNDFTVFVDDPGLAYNSGRAFIYGRSATNYLLHEASTGLANLRAVFRAHQHSSVPNSMMNRLVISNGVFRHWQSTDRQEQALADPTILKTLVETNPERSIPDGSVWTFNVSPDSVYGIGNSYWFDTIGILKTGESFKDWRLQVENVSVE